MPAKKRFCLGAARALLPVLVSVRTLDIATILDTEIDVSKGVLIGPVIRHAILFTLGGFVGYLHVDELQPLKLVVNSATPR